MPRPRGSKNKSRLAITDQQMQFAMEIAQGLTIKEAAFKLGVTPNTAYGWHKQENVREFMRSHQQKFSAEVAHRRAQKFDVTKEDIFHGLWRIACTPTEKASDRIAAYKELADRMGFTADAAMEEAKRAREAQDTAEKPLPMYRAKWLDEARGNPAQ